MDTPTPVVVASGLTLRTRRGPVFGPIDLTVYPGQYVVCTGPAGSGKTALLLALAGRMRPSSGTLLIAGVDARRQPASARRHCAMAVFAGLNELPDTLTVRDAIASESYLSPARVRRVRPEAVAASVGLEAALDTKIDALSEAQRCVLGIGLALMSDPAVLVVDQIGDGLTRTEQDMVDAVLRAAASRGVAVIGACVDAHMVAGADIIVPMSPASPPAEGEVSRAFAEAR